MDPIAIAVIAVLILIFLVRKKAMQEKTVEETTDSTPPPPSEAPETTEVYESPPETVTVMPSVGGPPYVTAVPTLDMEGAKIELYTEKNFKGSHITVSPGNTKVQFAVMNADKTLSWQYQSMRIVPGTYLMFTGAPKALRGVPRMGFAVGKYDVPDMFAFIKSHGNIGDGNGISIHSTSTPRPFYISVLTESDWDKHRTSKHKGCLAYTRRFSPDRQARYCSTWTPESGAANLTGFRNLG